MRLTRTACWLWLLWAGALRADVSVLTWNVAGNSFTDFSRWSTNAPELQAAGRILGYLQPDVLTLQEIPYSRRTELTNFVRAFLPAHSVVFNSGTDGYLCSAILSRFPIRRSQSHLDGVSLAAFGSSAKFTRDLFEAEIAVPGWPSPLHVFTTHLKSGGTTDDVVRRGAEALAISNYLAHTFVTQYPDRPFVLTGDFNEDISSPRNAATNPVPLVVNAATSLRLLTPVNPLTHSERTWSIRGSVSRRYDYVLPAALLSTNVLSSQVFRSDQGTEPLPASDNATASDHLPVMVRFADPFPKAFAVTEVAATNGLITLRWETFPGFTYQVEHSGDLHDWTVLPGTPGSGTLTFSVPAAPECYRVRRTP
ncbi:MAG TPA: endonuclease/exonuclease/phosphatase family protein [Candidatus Limnocylindria bacterium]|jgi:endonuclease/exonuclease/phosphatase family metal-dependent hydrolase|nr:endonuclease/exonuclease/phosphatase family protein [Candidatus Limnocylindria bacterium]